MACRATYIFLCVSFFCSLQPSLSFSSTCALPWNANATLPKGVDRSAICPYGRLLIFDVTLPKDADSGTILCVLYGFVPFLVVIVALCECVVRLLALGSIGTRELSFLVFVFVVTVVNEIGVKQVASEPRPERSCNFSCGMPSGHATMSVGFFTLLFLDGIFRVTPKTPMTVEAAKKEIADKQYRIADTRWNLLKDAMRPKCTKRFWSMVPLSSLDVISHREFVKLIFFWGMLLVPVPYSRIIVEDHTPEQVMIGGLLGIWEACVWFVVINFLRQRYNHRLGERVCFGITHNYAVPRFAVRSKCVLLLAWAERQSRMTTIGRENMCPVTLQELRNMLTQIDWYMQLTHECLIREGSETEHEFLDLEMFNLRPLQRQVCRELNRNQALMEEDARVSYNSGDTQLSNDRSSISWKATPRWGEVNGA